jgi:DNA-binding NarL/FixJ family response regulator
MSRRPPHATIGPMASVLIVDDHDTFRVLARAVLEASGFTVAGEAADGESALTTAEQARPDIVLLDIQLPGIDGFAVAERFAQMPSPPAVVLVSTRDQDAYRQRLSETPALGFITKSDFSGRVLEAMVGSSA